VTTNELEIKTTMLLSSVNQLFLIMAMSNSYVKSLKGIQSNFNHGLQNLNGLDLDDMETVPSKLNNRGFQRPMA
jgi:hypothetical protein